jgi:hypothetical protein
MIRNVSGAQRELLKYYASVTSNRWLMLKIFGVLIIFVSTFSTLGEERSGLMVVLGIYPCIVIVMYHPDSSYPISVWSRSFGITRTTVQSYFSEVTYWAWA